MIKAHDIAQDFEEIIGWPYKSPGSNDQNGIDCSGAFVRSYRKHGMTIAHGSNSIYRNHCSATGPIGGIGDLHVGMVVFKHRNDGKEPTKYQGDGIGNLYHIGLVTSISPLRIAHATDPIAKVDTTLSNWTHCGWLEDVDYAAVTGGGDQPPAQAAAQARVWSADGNPVKLRPTPGTNKPYLAKVPRGEMVSAAPQAEGWSQVNWKGKRGYMRTEFLDFGNAQSKGEEQLALRVQELERLMAECGERLSALEKGDE